MGLLSRGNSSVDTGFLGIRVSWDALRRTFWPTSNGAIVPRQQVNYGQARALYRNDDRSMNLGSGFSKPIIDLTVQFMGIPRAVTGDEILDEFLNDCIRCYWPVQIQEMIRNSCRDSKTVVRMRRADTDDPLVTAQESAACYLEVLMPEQVEIIYMPENALRIARAIVTHQIEMEEDDPRRKARTNGSYIPPRLNVHNIIEEITPDEFTYFDETTNEWREDMRRPNTWGFVPLLEVFNEWDSTLGGGQSDLESSAPFIKAFHDVFSQALSAHGYHSIPKAKFKINDIGTFLANNFPDSFEKDEQGRIIPGTFNGKVSWKGTEILFMQSEEDAGFLEAKSVLGDSKTLLEFIFDCICVASETPEWAFMRVEGATQGAATAQTLPLVRKIERKRVAFTQTFQMLCKMVLSINSMSPIRPQLDWDDVSPQDAVTLSQGLNQTVMALEVAAQRQVISDRTYREHLRKYIPEMNSPQQEAQDAEENVVLNATPNSAAPADAVPGGQQGRNE
jgi:hypothetical protein